MSRAYRMQLLITGIKEKELKAVLNALTIKWNWDLHFNKDKTTFTITADDEGSLCGGESEEDFAIGISQAVWAVTGRYVPVNIGACYLEDLPFTDYESDKKDFEKFAKTLTKKRKTQ